MCMLRYIPHVYIGNIYKRGLFLQRKPERFQPSIDDLRDISKPCTVAGPKFLKIFFMFLVHCLKLISN